MSLIGWILLLFIAGILNIIIGLAGIKKFLSATLSITNTQDLQNFKDMVRQQMYQSTLQILVLGIMGITGIYGIMSKKLDFMEFILFLLLNGAIFLFGMYAKKIENQARSLNIGDETLAEEYATVCESWLKKPFPDF